MPNMKGKKRWLTAGLAGIAAVIAALVPATAPLVEVLAAEVATLLVGSQLEPAVAHPGEPDPAEKSES